MAAFGATKVVTTADRRATIEWYRNPFGDRQIGTVGGEHEFGDPAVGEWTTLQTDLGAWLLREAGADLPRP